MAGSVAGFDPPSLVGDAEGADVGGQGGACRIIITGSGRWALDSTPDVPRGRRHPYRPFGENMSRSFQLAVGVFGPTTWQLRRGGRSALMVVATCLALTWGAGLGAQEEEAASDAEGAELFAETIDVNVVNVDVYVTDRDGQRVEGLEREDFELVVDKSPVGITNFYAVEGGGVRPEPGVETLPEAQTLPVDRSVQRLPEEQQLHLIVYVDNFNLHPFTRNRALGSVRTFLRSRLHPGDRVMLVSYDRSLHIRHPFTSDPDLIASALFEIEEMTGHAVHFDSERRDVMNEIYEATDAYQVRGRAAQYAESLFSDMRFTLDALNELVESLAGLPGRKGILYVSDGLSMRPGEDVFHAMTEHFQGESSLLLEGQRYDLSRNFQALTSRANANRVTFYALEAAGLRTYSYMDASNASFNGGSQVDQVHFSNLQSSLRFMAGETGGFAMVNTNDFSDMLGRMGDDFENYYSLGFHPGAMESGRYHRIEVRLKDPAKGLKVRHREGFRDKPVVTRMTDGTLAALNYGYERNPMGVELEFGERTPQENGNYLVSLKVKIPIGSLSFFPQTDLQRGKVRLYVGAMDAEGGVAPVQEVPVPIDIPQAQFEEARTKFYQYEMKLLMRTGRQVVAVGVRDDIGATSGFVSRGVTL